MGKAARLKLERRLVAPVRKQEPRIQPKLVWLATGVLATVTAVVVIVLVATRSQPTVPAAAAATAADRNAPASLVQAANNVGFHPTTEPGVGLNRGSASKRRRRSALPGPPRPERAARDLQQPRRSREGDERLPGAGLPDLLRDQPGRLDHLARRRRTTRGTAPRLAARGRE